MRPHVGRVADHDLPAVLAAVHVDRGQRAVRGPHDRDGAASLQQSIEQPRIGNPELGERVGRDGNGIEHETAANRGVVRCGGDEAQQTRLVARLDEERVRLGVVRGKLTAIASVPK